MKRLNLGTIWEVVDMAECIFCKRQIPNYGGYADGGCEQLKKDPLPLALDGVCECFEMVNDELAGHIAIAYDREKGLKYLKEIVEKRNRFKNIKNLLKR